MSCHAGGAVSDSMGWAGCVPSSLFFLLPPAPRPWDAHPSSPITLWKGARLILRLEVDVVPFFLQEEKSVLCRPVLVRLLVQNSSVESVLLLQMGSGFKEGFLEARRKSRWIGQFECSNQRCRSSKKWWGAKNKDQHCCKCRQQGVLVPFEETIGIGWFKCGSCSRRFAGFCRGDVLSKCLPCKKPLTAEFIVPGNRAAGPKKKKKHNCEACHGHRPCPIVEEALALGGAE
jgi:hypothetical protein